MGRAALQRLVGPRLEERVELLDGQTGFANERSKRAFRDRLVLGDNEAAVRRFAMAEHDVAVPLGDPVRTRCSRMRG